MSMRCMAASGAPELYVDTESKQVFTEPGPNRVRLGLFRARG